MCPETKVSEVEITRVLHAPRELVWRAWTEPTEMAKWWGPKDWTLPQVKMDFRVGGKVLSCMRGPDGAEIWSGGEYLEIEPPSRLVLSDYFCDEDGNVVPPSHYGMEGDWPEDNRIEVTFEEYGDNTTMTMRHGPMPSSEMASGANQGWSESFDKLAATLAGSSGS